MMTRDDQSLLYNELIKSIDIDINTKSKDDGEFLSIPVQLYWGSEPAVQEMPCVVISFTSMNIPIDRALGDIWANSEEGLILGFQGQDMMLIKVKSVDVVTAEGNLNKQDLAQHIMQKIYNLIMFNWNGKLKDSSVTKDKYPIHNVSSIVNNEIIYELQVNIGFTCFVGGIPEEEGILDITAPFIQNVTINMGILPNTNQIEINV